jgi:hypothetical protein
MELCRERLLISGKLWTAATFKIACKRGTVQSLARTPCFLGWRAAKRDSGVDAKKD